MENLELYYIDICPYSRKVLNFIEDNNLIDKVELKDIRAKDEYRQSLIKIGGQEQVPCLFVNGSPMYESEDIIKYLKENLV